MFLYKWNTVFNASLFASQTTYLRAHCVVIKAKTVFIGFKRYIIRSGTFLNFHLLKPCIFSDYILLG